MPPADNSRYLAAAATRRRADTLDRARRTLEELGRTGQRYTVTQIAAHASVSRAWLYAQAEFRDGIRRLTTAAPMSSAPAASDQIEHGSDASLRQRLALAHERIRELDVENHRLREQIALLHGQLRAARIDNTHVKDTVNDTKHLLTAANYRTSPR